MHRFVRFAVTTAVLLLAVVAVAAQNGSAHVVGGDEATLRELVSRLFTTYPNYSDQEATVYVGRLPDDFLYDFNLPDNVRVLGSVVRGSVVQGGGWISMVLTTDQTPESVIRFFDDTLNGDDWKTIEGEPVASFLSGTTATGYYCDMANNVAVSINAYAYGSNTDVRIYINPDSTHFCDDSAGTTVNEQEPQTLLPKLITPDGVRLLNGINLNILGLRSSAIQAYIESDLSIDEIAAAYSQQLEVTGWQRTDMENGYKLAWSAWRVEGRDQVWAATLIITASPTADNQYIAEFVILEPPT